MIDVNKTSQWIVSIFLLVAPTFTFADTRLLGLGSSSSGKAPLSDFTSLLSPGWYNRITISGFFTTAGFFSNKTPTTIGVIPSHVGTSPRATDIAIPFAALIAEAKLTDWMTTLFSIAYAQTSPSFLRSPDGGGNSLILEQAFVRFANPLCSPFYAQVGWQYINFGGLELSQSSFIESTVQLMSNTRETMPTIGFNWLGLDGSVYIFRGLNQVRDINSTNARTYGAALSYDHEIGIFKYKIAAGYISNMVSAYYIASTVAKGSPLNNGYYTEAVHGLDLHASAYYREFDLSLKYIGALNSFALSDLHYTTNGGRTFTGARPAAWGANIGFSFPVCTHKTRLGIGYQGSSQSVALGKASGSVANPVAGVYGNFFAIGMPKLRYYANYNIGINRWSDLGFEAVYDRGYPVSNGGTGRSAGTGIMVLTARFG